MTLNLDAVALTAFALALVRASVFVFIAPPFSTRAIPITVKAGLAAVLALSAAGHIQTSALINDTGAFVGAMVMQALIGVVMGLTVMLLMTAVQSAGAIVDVFAGFSMASLYDPFSDTSTSLFGRFYQLLATTLVFATNGHLLIAKGFYTSFEIFPADKYDPATIAHMLSLNFAQLFVAALEIAGPVVACLFLSELTMGLVSRAAPSLNVFSLAFPVRVGVTLLVVAAAVPLLGPAVTNLLNLGVRSFLGGG